MEPRQSRVSGLLNTAESLYEAVPEYRLSVFAPESADQ
jgi:hypothetical protein